MPAFSTTAKNSVPLESRSLFHYTNAAGLVGIIKTQTLFATHANFLNDSTECRILRDILKPRLTREMEEIVPQLIKRKRLLPALYKEYGENIHAMQADKVLDAIITAIERIAPFYIASFCLHSKNEPEYENGLLSQWRGYANGGFALEFDEIQLDRLAELENLSFRYQGILTNTVSYFDHDERADSDSFDDLGRAMLRELFEDQGGDLDRDFGQTRFDHYTRPFLQTLPFLKDAGFAEEREYRLAALCNRPGKAAETDNRRVREVEFRESASGGVVPYIRIFDGLEKKLPIKGILVGPHQNQDNQITALQLLLDRYNIEAEVRRSKLTFRRT
jgi:hypothetical protein